MPAKKIILSDDAVLMTILENSFFKREGFDLVCVEDGQTGYQAVEVEAPTLAIFDLAILGEEQSLECCRQIKADALLSMTPVLLLLPENSRDELPDACWSAGCDAVVHRPLSAERFLDAACGLLGISRRLAKRFPVSFQLALIDKQQKKHIGSCINLNVGGMFLATETLFPVETHLTIEFALPGYEDSMKCPVRVAWVNHPEWRKKNSLPCGLGLQFLAQNSTVKLALAEFVDSLKQLD